MIMFLPHTCACRPKQARCTPLSMSSCGLMEKAPPSQGEVGGGEFDSRLEYFLVVTHQHTVQGIDI